MIAQLTGRQGESKVSSKKKKKGKHRVYGVLNAGKK
jgi:hypothetical protein